MLIRFVRTYGIPLIFLIFVAIFRRNMKQIIRVVLLLFLLSLFACKDRPYPRTLIMADSLTYSNPDSAITILKELKEQMNSEPETTQMYYRLLQIRANDNAYIPYSSDSLIKAILTYYQDKKDNTHLPEVYYYAGRIYLDLGDTPKALQYLQKAIEVLNGSSNYRLISKTYQQVGTLYLYQHVSDKALATFKEAFHYTKLSGDNTLAFYNMRSIGRSFVAQTNMDSAFYYYKKAEFLAQKMGNRALVSSIGLELARIYEHSGKYEEALTITRNSYISPEDPAQYAILAHLYNEAGKLDSACYYYTKLLSTGNRYDNLDGYYVERRNCYKGLSDIARQQGKLAEALAYMDKYFIYTDSVQHALDTESIRKTNALYNYQLREKENIRLETIAQKQKVWIVSLLAGIIITLIIAISTGIIYNLRKRQRRTQAKRQQEKLKEIADEQYRSSRKFVEENEERIEAFKKKLQNTESQKDELEKSLQEAEKKLLELTNKQIKVRQKLQTLSETAFKESQIYKDFYHVAEMPNSETISGKEKITQKDWEVLATAINRTYNNFTERLRNLYPDISTHELRICMLIKIGIPPMGIAKLTTHSKQAITSSRKKLYQKTHNQPGSPDLWDNFIQKF